MFASLYEVAPPDFLFSDCIELVLRQTGSKGTRGLGISESWIPLALAYEDSLHGFTLGTYQIIKYYPSAVPGALVYVFCLSPYWQLWNQTSRLKDSSWNLPKLLFCIMLAWLLSR